ncbi:MAG: hypothetical protein HYS25_09320 [Ignavibacteriales bacterium]|nr:hypothetical protein [Ignavibacteriales bacterium]
MMKPVFYSPSKKCSPLAALYVFLKYDEANETLYDKYIPDGHSSFVFHFGGKSFDYRENGKKKVLPRFFITNLISSSLDIESLEAVKIFFRQYIYIADYFFIPDQVMPNY